MPQARGVFFYACNLCTGLNSVYNGLINGPEVAETLGEKMAVCSLGVQQCARFASTN